jgi:1,4-dihydroxy-2-naphthoate octaprenyltransferase
MENDSKSGVGLWIAGARPRTLPAAVVPVLVGASCVVGDNAAVERWWCGVLALVVSLALQIGVNYANDYSDGVKGTDAVRVGPIRLVGSGLVAAKKVKIAAMLAFGVAAIFGLVIALTVSLWLIVVGVASIAAGWFYTGGPKPYGYLGLGEVFVFVFFGVVATTGTTYAISEQITGQSLAASVVVGCLACALLVVNNLRDIPTDTTAGKNTLAVRMGDKNTRVFYFSLFATALAMILWLGFGDSSVLLGAVGLIAAIPAIKLVSSGAKGRDLIAVLEMTGRAQLLTGLALSVGLLV